MSASEREAGRTAGPAPRPQGRWALLAAVVSGGPRTLAAGGGPGSRGESRTVLRFSERWAGGTRGCRLAGTPPGVPEWQQVPCELAAGVPPIPCSRPAWPRLRRVGRARVLGWTLTRLAVCAPPSLRPAGKARRTSRSSAGGAALGVQPGPGCTRPCSWPRGQFPTEHWDLQSGEPQDQVKRGGLLMFWNQSGPGADVLRPEGARLALSELRAIPARPPGCGARLLPSQTSSGWADGFQVAAASPQGRRGSGAGCRVALCGWERGGVSGPPRTTAAPREAPRPQP